MLTGNDLLAKVRELGDAGKSEIVRECGYVSTKKDGGERLNFTAFYEAILEARGVTTAAVEKEELLTEYPDQKDTLAELLEDYDADAVKAFIEYFGEECLESFEDSYQGEMTGAEFAQQITEDCYGVDLPGFVEIDWQATWENLERYDYSEQDGFIFCCYF